MEAFSEEVSALILKINEGLPENVQLRYNELIQRSVEGNLSKAEHLELTELIPKIEAKNVERLSYLVELAALWKCSIDEVMERLHIQTPPIIHK